MTKSLKTEIKIILIFFILMLVGFTFVGGSITGIFIEQKSSTNTAQEMKIQHQEEISKLETEHNQIIDNLENQHDRELDELTEELNQNNIDTVEQIMQLCKFSSILNYNNDKYLCTPYVEDTDDSPSIRDKNTKAGKFTL